MRIRRPRQSTRRCVSVAILGISSLILSSCLSVEFRSDFDRDGTTSHELAIVIPRDEFDATITGEVLAAWEDIEANASEAGLDPQRIDTAESVTFQVSVERPDGDDAGAALNSLLNATGLNPSPGISAPFQGSFVQEGSAIGGTNFVLDLTVDGPLLVEALTASELAGEIESDAIDDIVITYQAGIPGSLGSTTSQETNGERLVWQIANDTTTDVRAESSAGAPGTTALFIMAALASIVGVIGLAAIVGWILARRPALASSIGASARYFPRRTTLTREGLWVAYRVRLLVDRIWHSSAPRGETPVQHELLESVEEGRENGPDTEGDRPPAGVRGG